MLVRVFRDLDPNEEIQYNAKKDPVVFRLTVGLLMAEFQEDIGDKSARVLPSAIRD